MKTGFTAFFYSLRTVMLPFLFIFNTDLLLIDVGVVDGIAVFIVATVGMLIFAAGTQGFFIARSKIWESVALILIAFTLFRPGFWLDQVQAPFVSGDPGQLERIAGAQPDNAEIRIFVSGQNAGGDDVETTVVLPLGAKGDGASRLEGAGIRIIQKDGKTIIDDVITADLQGKPTAAGTAKLEFDMVILSAEVPQERMPKQLFYIPAILLLVLVWGLQRRRVPAKSNQTAAA